MCHVKRLYCNICHRDRPVPRSAKYGETRIVMVVQEILCGRDYCNFANSVFPWIQPPSLASSCGSERCSYEDCTVTFLDETCDHHHHRPEVKKPCVRIKECVTGSEAKNKCLIKF